MISAPLTASETQTSRQIAVIKLIASQKPDGPWPTLYTNAPVFESPAEQTDIFVAALIVELLEPFARELEIERALDRSRNFLRSTVRPDGLVHYGAPDQSIPPDADSTSLALRIARVAPTPAALDALEARRREDGLYRTWLKPGGIPEHPAVGTDPKGMSRPLLNLVG